MAINYCSWAIIVGILIFVAGGGTALKINNKVLGIFSGSSGAVFIGIGLVGGIMGLCG